MYGIALEAMAQASYTLQRPEMPGYMKRAADWILANPKEWDPLRRVFLNAPVHAVMLTLSYSAIRSGSPGTCRWRPRTFPDHDCGNHATSPLPVASVGMELPR
jgi:hypothetical protein